MVAALLLLLLAASLRAHNGATAIAVPVQGITVDGDLADWPAGLRVYPIRENTEVYGPTDLRGADLDTSRDFSPQFMVGYSLEEHLIYVAVRVRDDQVKAGIGVLSTDACEVYLTAHRSRIPAQYLLFPPGGNYRPSGRNPVLSMVNAAGAQELDPGGVGSKGAYGQQGDTLVYEWALRLLGAFPQDTLRLEPGMTVGFDVVAVDKDDDPGSPSWVAWTPYPGKMRSAVLGDLVLAPADYAPGVVTGQVVEEGTGRPLARRVVQASRDLEPVASVRTDSTGAYRLNLLPGDYTLGPGVGQDLAPFATRVSVHSGACVAADLTVTIDPILVRLSFWVRPDAMAAFAAVYDARIAPILQRHGWVPSEQTARPGDAAVFSRLFEVTNLLAVQAPWAQLQGDPDFVAALRDLRSRFGVSQPRRHIVGERAWPDSLLTCTFSFYSASFGPGSSTAARGVQWHSEGQKRVAGGGSRKGVFDILGVSDGLRTPRVNDVLQDRSGNLWLATPEGAYRYDGHTLQVFAVSAAPDAPGTDGIWPLLEAWRLLEDRTGAMWFASRVGGGVTRYDGQTFTTFRAEDGLASNLVIALLEDRSGKLWFGTSGGVSRYDGQSLSSWGAEDGLRWTNALLEDRQGRMWFGTGDGLMVCDGKRLIQFTVEDGLPKGSVTALLEDRQGRVWVGTAGGGAPSYYDGERFRTPGFPDTVFEESTVRDIHEDAQGRLLFATQEKGVVVWDGNGVQVLDPEDGLPSYDVSSIASDDEGYLWFATEWGVGRYWGEEMRTLTTRDGLANNDVTALLEDHLGRVWIATVRGVSCYDRGHLRTFDTRDGLAQDNVLAILEDRHGRLWFGTQDGVSRFDGHTFTTYTTRDGLAENNVRSILEDRRGQLWFGTNFGVSRYDGRGFTNFTTADGLAHNQVLCSLLDRDGHLWFGGPEGRVSRYDGSGWQAFTSEDGLLQSDIWGIAQDRDGHLWFGSMGVGVSRYDGRSFRTLTTRDGLPYDFVGPIHQGHRGDLWFGTFGGGAARYDGRTFQVLGQADGLANDAVFAILEDRQGDLWFGTTTGVTRFRPPPPAHPPVVIDAVVADQRYEGAGQVAIPSTVSLVAFEFHGVSFKTRPEAMVYRYRLQGHDPDWRTTKARRVEYEDLAAGTYAFQVEAVDRDLGYSQQPAVVGLRVHLPYERLALLAAALLGFAAALSASGYALRKRRALRRAERALMRELEEELQTAHDMQMGLMPAAPPRVEGLEVAGRCLPANHVGGDMYGYFQRDGQLHVALADVTGHDMEAALPVVLFGGILDNQMETPKPLEELCISLNRSMCRLLAQRTFICFSMTQIATAERKVRVVNCGCPYPLHYRAQAGIVGELQVDAYPLGIRPETQYRGVEAQLEEGDYLVLLSDGLVEAMNIQQEAYGFERVSEVVRHGCSQRLSAEGLIDRLVGEVAAFRGDAPQADDMTCVVVRVVA